MNRQGDDVVELVTALRAGKIDLAGALEALSRRGVLPEAEYSVGVETLYRLRAERVFDDDTVTTLVRRMDALRAGSAPGDDATVVAPVPAAGGDAPPAAVDDDATVVAPSGPRGGDAAPVVSGASDTPSGPGSPDAPATPGASGEADATRFVPRPPGPAPRAGGHDTQGTDGTSASTSGWSGLAEAAVGDVATAGMLLKGRFLLERELGRGGMGVVFLARDERKVEAHDRDPYVAVKVLNDEFRRHPDSLVALQRESRRSQRLAHDNIVRVYDFDKAGTIVFMTMEYIDGSDLRTLIREQAWNGMPLSRARPLIEGMASALARAHAAGVVHSDFKPGNVMVTGDGTPKVFDFGIARAGKHGGATGEQTVFDAATLGALTPAYASLEMIQGEDPSPRDDLYALGCVCYELLTGKHPFDKVSAEVALREGRVPPRVPGLSRRQARTLRSAVAFRGADRLPSVEALLEGLREVPLRRRVMPWVGYGTAAAILLGGAGWGTARYLHERQLAGVIVGFAEEGEAGFADEAAALAALSALDEQDRSNLVVSHNREIEAFLLRRLDALWQPDAGRYAYADAQRVFALRDDLRLYSPQIDARRAQMDLERDELLNAFDTELAALVDAGAIFPGRSPNATEVLARVREIDPASALLRQPALEIAYEQAVSDALDARDAAAARQRLNQAMAWYPDSLRLQLQATEVEDAEALAARRRQPAAASPQDPASARTLLSERIATPAADAGWRDDVAAALATLDAAQDPQRDELRTALARAIAHHAAGMNDPVRLAQAQALVAFGLEQVPTSEALRAESARLDTAQAALQARLARDSAEAEAAMRTEGLRRAAAAGDLDKAGEALARLRELQPGTPFVDVEAPQLLANAYLAAAERAFERDRPEAAVAGLDAAGAHLGERLELRTARARYAFAAALQAAMRDGTDTAGRAALAAQLSELRQRDAAGAQALEAALRTHGRLPAGTLDAQLAALDTRDAATTAQPRAARDADERARAADASPGDAQAPAAIDPEDVLPPVPSGPDPCGRPGLVGRGRFCFDTIGEGRGPTLVVVPGVDGGPAFGLGRAEVTVAEFNTFCAATERCRPTPLSDPALGAVAVSNVPATLVRAYVRWLIHATGGWRYRLPTEAEWAHAAAAASDWRQAADSHCIPPTAGGEAAVAPVSARGRAANPWGLINLSGNVWEWTEQGGALAVRGGAYTSLWSDCTAGSRRADGGAAQRDVGFRVLRELK